jgi:hypothetical protein
MRFSRKRRKKIAKKKKSFFSSKFIKSPVEGRGLSSPTKDGKPTKAQQSKASKAPNIKQRTDLPICKKQSERIRRDYFSYKRSRPHSKSGGGQHNDRFTVKPCI